MNEEYKIVYTCRECTRTTFWFPYWTREELADDLSPPAPLLWAPGLAKHICYRCRI